MQDPTDLAGVASEGVVHRASPPRLGKRGVFLVLGQRDFLGQHHLLRQQLLPLTSPG